MAQVTPKRVQCLDLTGGLLVHYLPLALSEGRGGGGVLAEEEEYSRLVAPELQRLVHTACTLFAQPEPGSEMTTDTATSSDNDMTALAVLSPATVMWRRSQALALHQAGIAVTTAQSRISRKQLQSRLRVAVEVYRPARLARLKKCCDEKLTDLTQTLFTEEQRDHSSSLNLQLKLGESGNVYSQFLTFKNALEKIVHQYLALDTAALLSEGETNMEREEEEKGDSSASSALSFYLEVEEVEASMLKHDVLYAFVSQQVRLILQMGDAWVGAYEKLAVETVEKTQSLEDNCSRMEVRWGHCDDEHFCQLLPCCLSVCLSV